MTSSRFLPPTLHCQLCQLCTSPIVPTGDKMDFSQHRKQCRHVPRKNSAARAQSYITTLIKRASTTKENQVKMMGSFITRGITMALGFVYPAYECYKVVEKKSPELEHLQFWCQYWMIIAVVTVLERLGDVLIYWVPMYSEAKLAFVIYLWYPKTMGTTYIYNSFLRPFVANHEVEIDQNLNELKTRAGDVALLWCQRGSIYVQTRFFELLQFLALQSDRARKVSVSTESTPIAPTRPFTQGLSQGHPQNDSFYPPQPLLRTTGVGIHLDPYCLQGDQVGQGTHLLHKSRSDTLSNGEEELCYYKDQVERSGAEQTLPLQVLKTKILADNPW